MTEWQKNQGDDKMRVRSIINILVCLSVLFLTSCVDVPDNVRERYNTSGSVKANTGDQESEYISTPLSDMNASVSDYIETLRNLELNNMTFSEYLSIDIPTELKMGNFICPTGFQDKYVELFTHYDEDFDEKNVVSDESSYPTGPTYTNPDKNLEMSIGCTGYFFFNKGLDLSVYFNGSNIKTYSYNEALNSSDKYNIMITNEEMSVADAAEKAQGFANDFVKAVNYPNDINLVRITLCECDAGYFYSADYTQSVSGANIIEYHSRYSETDENMRWPWTFAYIYEGEVKTFAINSSFNEYETTGTLTETVDIKYAAEYVSNYLADKMDLDVKRIAFEYLMLKTDNIQEKTEDIKTDEERVSWALYISYDLYKAEPCWVFYFDETPEKEKYAILHCDDMSVDFIDNSKR